MCTIVLIGCVESVQEGERESKEAEKSALILSGCSLLMCYYSLEILNPYSLWQPIDPEPL